MVMNVNLRPLPAKLLLALWLGPLAALAQTAPPDTLAFTAEITAFSQDRTGNVFLAFAGGAISKYSPALDSLIAFSPARLGDITLLEAWHGFQIFAFYADFQEYALLDRFLTRDTRYRLSSSPQDYIDISTISSDQKIWAFEESQLRLVKRNPNIREVTLEVPLEFIIDADDHRITYLREYQNLVFMVDALSGIYIFDNLGNYLKKIAAAGITHCSFYDDNLFYITGNRMVVANLYKAEQQELILPAGNYLGVLPSGNRFYLVSPKHLVGPFALE